MQQQPRVYFDILIDDRAVGQLVFQLRTDVATKTCDNFLQLCTGEAGFSVSGYSRTYKQCNFTRIIPNQICQAGDFTTRDGTGGESIYGTEPFPDETFALTHVGAGILSMVNAGKDSNRSQFYITLGRMPEMDNSHVAFGYLVEGFDTLKAIEACGTPTGKPTRNVVISNCGKITSYKS